MMEVEALIPDAVSHNSLNSPPPVFTGGFF